MKITGKVQFSLHEGDGRLSQTPSGIVVVRLDNQVRGKVSDISSAILCSFMT